MVDSIRFIQYGLGPIGQRIARLALEKKGLEIVGAIDIAEDIVGKDVGEVLQIGQELGVKVSKDSKVTLEETKPDIVLHATSSFLEKIIEQIRECIKSRSDMISTSEELSYPYHHSPELSSEIDKLAREYGVTVLGTGVNPGFVMDALAIAVTGVCANVEKVSVTRVVDASTRRLPLQRKIGAGMTVDEFRERAAKGGFGHIGLLESALMLADALGFKLDKVYQSLDPAIAEKKVETRYLTVEAGQVAGIDQSIEGLVNDRTVIELKLQMYIGASEPHDTIVVKGVPDLEVTVKGGVPGDIATAAIVVNSIPRVLNSHPGLMTVKDLPMAAAIMSDIRSLVK